MYKDFNVIAAVFLLILNSILVFYLSETPSYTTATCINSFCVFMVWLDGKIDSVVDDIKKEMQDKR
jgi:hypothetical protein